jgi:RNA polymerase sigma-70 factor (ECF subfamily)
VSEPLTATRRLDRCRLGDQRERLVRAAMVMTGSRHDAEDLVQETFVRVMRRPRPLRNADDLGYLMRTLRNTWLNQCRTRRAEARAVEESAALLERGDEPDPLLAVEVHALLEALAELPDIHRDAIAAVDVLGLSYKQAARALRTREGTLMSRLFRARVRLGEVLDAP